MKLLEESLHASSENQEVISEVEDVKESVQENLEETPNDLQISNEGSEKVVKEIDDVEEVFKKLE